MGKHREAMTAEHTPKLYKRVATMTGEELWNAMQKPHDLGTNTVLVTEVQLRLTYGIRPRRKGATNRC